MTEISSANGGQQQCPKCHSATEQVAFGEHIRLRRCVGCNGLMVKKAMFDALKRAWMAEEVIDIGAHRVGRKHDAMTNIDCPECHQPMQVLLDKEQTHVCVEFCVGCELLYLDAGELTDLKQLTLMDHVWDFMGK